MDSGFIQATNERPSDRQRPDVFLGAASVWMVMAARPVEVRVRVPVMMMSVAGMRVRAVGMLVGGVPARVRRGRGAGGLGAVRRGLVVRPGLAASDEREDGQRADHGVTSSSARTPSCA